MADMKAFNERFRVEKVNVNGDVDRVTVQLGLDGLKIMNAEGTRTMNSYELSHVSRWSMRGNNLILYTKTPVDVEERQITFRSSENTIRTVMDTLTCCCMQLCEILQSNGKSSSDKETANSLHQLVKGNGKKKGLPAVDEVEFWNHAEKQGYLQSQGEVTKFWRKRFFVLKQGYLFRFMTGDLNENTKPRGVVDLSKVTDVKDGRAVTGKANSIKLCTSSGYVCYVTDSETEMVEWMSALEVAMQRIVKHVAGVHDDEPPPPKKASSPSNDWVRQLQSSLGASGNSAPSSRYATIDIVGYDSTPATAPPATSSYSSYSGTIDYSQISGANIAKDSSRNEPTSDLLLNYGAPTSQAPSASSSYPSQYPSSAPSSAPYPTSSYPSSTPSYPSSTPSYYPSSTQSTAPSYPQQNPYEAPSLIDQVPMQAPAYPYYQQTPSYSAPQAAAPAGSPAGWQVLYTPDGKTYYHNPSTGTTQWEAPPGY